MATDMANTSLTPELVKLSTELAAAFAKNQKVISAKARIGLFYQNPDATDLFRKVNEYGEKLRNKSMDGMPPSEEEISKFDELRRNVVDNPLCNGFLESRQMLDEMLSTVNQYLVMAIEHGCAPTDEEVAAAMSREVSCSCGGSCHGDCDDCDGHCHDEEHGGEHECCCKGEDHDGEHECCCKGEGHGEGHECRCGKH